MPKCKTIFNKKSTYNYHVFKRTRPCNENTICINLKSPNNKFGCAECDKTYKYQSGLSRHVTLEHRKIINKDNIDENNPNKMLQVTLIDNILDKKNDIFKCPHCNNTFTFKSALNRHLQGRCKIKKQIEKNEHESLNKILDEISELRNVVSNINQKNKNYESEIKELHKNNKNLTNKIEDLISNQNINNNNKNKINNQYNCEIINFNDTNPITIIIENNNQTWFKASNITKLLNLKNTHTVLDDCVGDDDIINVTKLVNKNLQSINNFNNTLKTNTMLINDIAIFYIISSIKNITPITKQFKLWIREIITTIHKYGTSSINGYYEHINFYDDNMVLNFEKINVVYIGYIGRLNGQPRGEHLFKYGLQKLLIFVYIDYIININDLVVTPRENQGIYTTET
jgi:prophage antirepressor-like protein/uncharacterized C2H2 Zn-finger protein